MKMMLVKLPMTNDKITIRGDCAASACSTLPPSIHLWHSSFKALARWLLEEVGVSLWQASTPIPLPASKIRQLLFHHPGLFTGFSSGEQSDSLVVTKWSQTKNKTKWNLMNFFLALLLTAPNIIPSWEKSLYLVNAQSNHSQPYLYHKSTKFVEYPLCATCAGIQEDLGKFLKSSLKFLISKTKLFFSFCWEVLKYLWFISGLGK